MAVLNRSEKKFAKYTLPVVSWALFIFITSSIPGSKIPRLFSYQDILFHFFIYAVLGWLVARAIKNYRPGMHYMRCIYLSGVLGLVYALSDEFHQMFVPYRCPSVADVCVDGIGIIIGSLFFIGSRQERIAL